MLLNVADDLTGVELEPLPIEVLRHLAELHDEIARKVLRFGLAALLPPEADKCRLVAAHNGAGVRAADEGASSKVPCHLGLPQFRSLPYHAAHSSQTN